MREYPFIVDDLHVEIEGDGLDSGRVGKQMIIHISPCIHIQPHKHINTHTSQHSHSIVLSSLLCTHFSCSEADSLSLFRSGELFWCEVLR